MTYCINLLYQKGLTLMRSFKNKGGLHNRVTCRIHLHPFTLAECQVYARERGLSMSRKDLAECYMALGGIPYYWSYLERSYSVAQNFDRLFLRTERR